MSKFIFAYHGGSTPQSEEEGQKMIAAWMGWYESMEAALVDNGAPVEQSYTVSKDGVVENGGVNPLSGYTVIEAASYEDACEMAKGCPLIADGSGTVEVARIHEM